MKKLYLIFFLLLFFTIPIFAQETANNYEIGMSLAGFYFPFPTDPRSVIYNDIYTYGEADLTIFYFKDFKYFFYIFEYEMQYGFYSYFDLLFVFLKAGVGGHIEIGPLIIRASINLSPGFYYIDGYYTNEDPLDFNLYYYEYYDFYICAEPNLAIGLKLQKGFNFYILKYYNFCF